MNMNRLIYITTISIIIVVVFYLWQSSTIQRLLELPKTKSVSYIQKLKSLNQTIVTPNSFVFIGNSIVMQGKWNDLLGASNIVNHGLSGDRIALMIDRLDSVLDQKPAKLFIMIGINDLGDDVSNEYMETHYKKIMDNITIKSHETLVYFHSMLPTKNTGRDNAQIQEINAILKDLCKGSSYTYIDLYNVFKDKNGDLNMDFSTDGLHLNSMGYELWAKKISKYI
jgi:lysophospholipase L1-like esterase